MRVTYRPCVASSPGVKTYFGQVLFKLVVLVDEILV